MGEKEGKWDKEEKDDLSKDHILIFDMNTSVCSDMSLYLSVLAVNTSLVTFPL